MAITPLSPWPTDVDVATVEAGILRDAIGFETLDIVTAARWGQMASGRVERYAPDAPQAVKDEAVIRFAGYVSMMQFGVIQQETIGPKSMTFTTNHAAAFRYCGAAALLSPWRIRRGAPIQDE